MGLINVPLKGSKAHPEHPIQLENVDIPFYCDGCDEPGRGWCYRCKEPSGKCDKVFHKECVRADEMKSHPFSKGCHFKFVRHSPNNNNNNDGAGSSPQVYRICDACCTDVKGFYYVCVKHASKPQGHFIHPSCMKLENYIDVDGVTLELKGTVPEKCGLCGHKHAFDDIKGWSYVSTCKDQDMCLHIKCVKNAFMDEWMEMQSSQQHHQLIVVSGGGVGDGSTSASTITLSRKMIANAGGTSGTTSDSGKRQPVVLYGGKPSSFSACKRKASKYLKLAKLIVAAMFFGPSAKLHSDVIINTLNSAD